MAKIHVRGGSPLRIKFSDETGTDFGPVALEPDGKGWYYVVVEKDGKKIQANKRNPGDKYCFRSRGDIEIDFKSN